MTPDPTHADPIPTLIDASEVEAPPRPTYRGVVRVVNQDARPPGSVAEIVSKAIAKGPDEEARLVQSLHYGRVAVQTNYAGLSPQQRKFILNRALVDSDNQAARYAGVTMHKFRTWQKNPVFMRAYAMVFMDPSELTVTMLDNLLPKTGEVLENILSNPESRDRDKIEAAKVVMQSKGIIKPSSERGQSEIERILADQLAARGVRILPRVIDSTATIVDG